MNHSFSYILWKLAEKEKKITFSGHFEFIIQKIIIIQMDYHSYNDIR